MYEALVFLNSVILGLFAGSLLTEALLLVPFFRALPLTEFNRLHKEFGPRLYRYYAPLTISATVLPILTAAVALITGAPNSLPACVAAGLALAILATYFLYFQRANQSFADGRHDEASLKQELSRWASVHTFRTALAIGAFIASLLAAAGA